MSHARITDPTRGTLEFRQAQSDETASEAVADIAAQFGDDRPPLVHVQGRERDRTLTGRVTAPRRARNDADTDDWQQALANYVAELEGHVDEFQGNGYTFEDDVRDETFNAVYHTLEWTLSGGTPFEIQFDAELTLGRGVLERQAVAVDDASVQSGMDVAARVGGYDLPGLREMRVRRGFEYEVNAIYNQSGADWNDVVVESGVEHTIEFHGIHTGTEAERASADADLEAVVGEPNTTFETRFPGYSKDGRVLSYNSELQQGFGNGMHHYDLTFIEAIVA